MPVKTLQELGFDPNSGVMLGDVGTGAGAFPQPPVMNFIDRQNAQRRQGLTGDPEAEAQFKRNMAGATQRQGGGTPLVARGSWYSQLPDKGWVDRQDRPGSAAYHVGGRPIADSMQGIALPSRSTLGQWFNVTSPTGESYRLQQTDIGPAKWTGRGVDISAAAAHQMGYTPKTFPTDARFTVVPADGPPPGWEANVAAATNAGGVGYSNPARAAQGASTDPAELVRPQESSLANTLADFFANINFKPQPVTPAKTTFGFGEARPLPFAPIGQRR